MTKSIGIAAISLALGLALGVAIIPPQVVTVPVPGPETIVEVPGPERPVPAVPAECQRAVMNQTTLLLSILDAYEQADNLITFGRMFEVVIARADALADQYDVSSCFDNTLPGEDAAS
jgi:hypothetical protein